MKKIVTLFLALALVLSMSAALAENGDNTLNGNKSTIVVCIEDNRTPVVEWTYPAEIKIKASKSGDSWTFSLADTYKLVITTLLMKDTQTLNVGFGDEYSRWLQAQAMVLCEMGMGGTTPLQSATFNLTGVMGGFNADAVASAFTSNTWELPLELGRTLVSNRYEEPELNPHIISSTGTEIEVNEGLYFAVQLADPSL